MRLLQFAWAEHIDGSPTTYSRVSMGFDVEGRLKSVGTQTDFLSRSDGLRAWKAYDINMPASDPPSQAVEGATYYYYDRGNAVLECGSDGTVTAVNVFADDGLVSRKHSGNWRHYQFDQQGNVAHRLNSSETVLTSSKHDAYGGSVSIPGPTQGTDPYGYNGRWGYYTDSETGLHYCQQRYYDAAAGRWVTRDPIGYAGGMNLYGYCASGPVGRMDPDGRMVMAAMLEAIDRPWTIEIAVGFGGSWSVGHSWVTVTDPMGTATTYENRSFAGWGYAEQPGNSYESAVELGEAWYLRRRKKTFRGPPVFVVKPPFNGGVAYNCVLFARETWVVNTGEFGFANKGVVASTWDLAIEIEIANALTGGEP